MLSVDGAGDGTRALTLPCDNQRAVRALLGLAVGDALGTTVEFQVPGTFVPVSDMIGGGPFGLRAGQWTDDTSMALCLAESLLERRRLDPCDQLERYVRWWREGHLSSTGRCFDIGVQTREALAAYLRSGASQPLRADQRRAGNGSIVRLAPVPIFFAAHGPAVAAQAAGQGSLTTHPASSCVDACRYLGAMLATALAGADKHDVLAEDLWQCCGDGPRAGREIRVIAQGSFKHRQPPQIQGSGHVVRSLEAALWAVYHADDYASAVLAAVNLGDDADTTGAIAGQLAGAIYGADSIPRAWHDRTAMHDQIKTIAGELCAAGLAAAQTTMPRTP